MKLYRVSVAIISADINDFSEQRVIDSFDIAAESSEEAKAKAVACRPSFMCEIVDIKEVSYEELLTLYRHTCNSLSKIKQMLKSWSDDRLTREVDISLKSSGLL